MGGKVKIDLQKYKDAIDLIRKKAQAGISIKKTEFLDKYQLTKTTFRIMESMGIIKEKSSDKSGGTFYSWTYRQPANETDSAVALRVTNRIQEDNRAIYAKYSTPEWKKKAALRKLSKSKEIERKLPVIKQAPVVVTSIEEPALVITPQEALVETTVISSEVINLQPITESRIDRESFSLVGELTKADLMEKISLLISDKQIESFKIEVIYK
jgi:hypothetical protein